MLHDVNTSDVTMKETIQLIDFLRELGYYNPEESKACEYTCTTGQE